MPGNSFGCCRTGVKASWKARMLAFAAVLWAWSDESTPGTRFLAARKLVIKMFSWHLTAVDEVVKQGESPHRVSVAGALAAIRTVMRDYRWRPDPGKDLLSWLGEALIDTYVRHGSKASRNYPRKKHEKPAGKPVLPVASREQVACAKKLIDVCVVNARSGGVCPYKSGLPLEALRSLPRQSSIRHISKKNGYRRRVPFVPVIY